MKKPGISILVLITCVFVAFTMGFFIGRNQNHRTVEVSLAETTAPLTLPVETEATASTKGSTGVETTVPALPEETETESAAEEHPGYGEITPNGDGRININTATHSELMTLPGIGEVIAQRIIDYRTEHGDFRCVEDLLNVSGIGEKRLEALLDLVTVGG